MFLEDLIGLLQDKEGLTVGENEGVYNKSGKEGSNKSDRCKER
jgi:hypothetical protein